MIHLRKYFDSNGGEVDEDGNPIVRDMARDGDVVSVPLIWMDNKTARDPREVAWLRMCDRLTRKDALSKMRDARPDPWCWYRDWLVTHGNL